MLSWPFSLGYAFMALQAADMLIVVATFFFCRPFQGEILN
jgi:hypothetical protein